MTNMLVESYVIEGGSVDENGNWSGGIRYTAKEWAALEREKALDARLASIEQKLDLILAALRPVGDGESDETR